MKGISYNNIKTNDIYPGNRKHVSRYKPYRMTISRRYRKMARQQNEVESLDFMKKDINQLKSYKHTDKSNPLYRSLYSYKKSCYTFKCIDKKIRKSFHTFNDFEMNQFSRKVANFRMNKTSKDKIMWPPLYKYKGNLEKKPKPQTPRPQGSKRLLLKITKKSYPPEVLQPIYPTKVNTDSIVPNKTTNAVSLTELKNEDINTEISGEKAEDNLKNISKEEVDNLKLKIKLHRQSNVSLDNINRIYYKLKNISDKKSETIVHYLKSSLKKELDELKAVAPSKYNELMKEHTFIQLKLDNQTASEKLREMTKESRLMNGRTINHRMKNKQYTTTNKADQDKKVSKETKNESLDEKSHQNVVQSTSTTSNKSLLLPITSPNKTTPTPTTTTTTTRAFSTHHFFNNDTHTPLPLKIEEKSLHPATSCVATEAKYANCINTSLNNKKVLKYMIDKHKLYLESKSKKERIKSERLKQEAKEFGMNKSCFNQKLLSMTAGRDKMLNNKLKELKIRLKSHEIGKTSQSIFEATNNMSQATEQVTDVKPEEPNRSEVEYLKTENINHSKCLFNSQGMLLLSTKRFYSTSPKVLINENPKKKIAENKMAYQPLYLYKNDNSNDNPSKNNSYINELMNQTSAFDRVNTRIKVNLDNMTGGQIKINLEKMDDLKLGRPHIPCASYLQSISFPNKNEPMSKLKKDVQHLKRLIYEKLGKDHVVQTKIVCEGPCSQNKNDIQSQSLPTCKVKRTNNSISGMTSPCSYETNIMNNEDNALNSNFEMTYPQDSIMVLKEINTGDKKATDKSNKNCNVNKQNEKLFDSWKTQFRAQVFNNNQTDKCKNNQQSELILNHSDVSFPTKETGFHSGGLKLSPHCEFNGNHLVNAKQDNMDAKDCGSVISQKNENNYNGQLKKISQEQLAKLNHLPDAKSIATCKDLPAIKEKNTETSEKIVNQKLIQEMRTEVQKAYEKSLQDITNEVIKGSDNLSAKSSENKVDRSRCSHNVKRADNNLRKIKSLDGVNNIFEELYDLSKKEVAQMTSRSLDRLEQKQYQSKFDNLMSRIASKIYNRDLEKPVKNKKCVAKDDGKKNMSSLVTKVNSPLPPWMKNVFEKKKYSFNNSNVIDCRDKSNINLEITGPSGNVALKLIRDSKNGSLQATLSLPNCVASQNPSSTSNKELTWLEKRLKVNHDPLNKINPKLAPLTLMKKDNSSDTKEKDVGAMQQTSPLEKKIAYTPNKVGPPKSSEPVTSKGCTPGNTNPKIQLPKKDDPAKKKEDTLITSAKTPQPLKLVKSNENVSTENCNKPIISKSEETLRPAVSSNTLQKLRNPGSSDKPENTICPIKSEVSFPLPKNEVKLNTNVLEPSSSSEAPSIICPKSIPPKMSQEVKAELQEVKSSFNEKPKTPKQNEQDCSHVYRKPPSSLDSRTSMQVCNTNTSIEKSTSKMSLCTVRPRIKPINPGKKKTRPIPSEDSDTGDCRNDRFEPRSKSCNKKVEPKECPKKKIYNAAEIKMSDIPNKIFHIQQPMLKCFIVPDEQVHPPTPECSSCKPVQTGFKCIMKNANKKVSRRNSLIIKEKEKPAVTKKSAPSVICPRLQSTGTEDPFGLIEECKHGEAIMVDEDELENDLDSDMPTVTQANSQVSLFDTKSTVRETDDFTKKLKLPCLASEYEKTWYTDAGLNNARPTQNNYYYKISDMFFPKM